MRPAPRAASLVLSVLVVPAVLAAPVSGPAEPRPRPVAPELQTVPLPGSASGTVELPQRETRPFSVLGVTWRPSATRPDLEVEVRTRDVDGTWSGWRDLHGQTDDAPDGGTADTARRSLRAGTAPAFVGPSDGVQVRVEVASGPVPEDLRLDLVDPGESPADDLRGRRDAAQASTGQPAVVSRAGWGADESLRTCTPGYTGTPRVAFVHHTASTNDYTPEQAPAAVRGFYAYHVRSNGWCDLGYNFLVDRYGVVYEGRAGGIERDVLGAHTGGFNSNSFGVAMVGNFSTAMPPEALRASLRRVVAWKLGRSWADPASSATLVSGSGSKFRAGTSVVFDVVSGHRDAVNTSCPGDVGYGILRALREDVRQEMGAGLVTPSVTPSTLPPEGGPVTVSAGVLSPVAWQLDVTSAATGAAVRTLTGSAGSRVEAVWDGRDAAGAPVAPGRYALTLSGADGSDPVVPWTGSVAVQSADGSAPVSPAPSPSPSASPPPVTAPSPSPPVSPRAPSAPPATGAGSLFVPLPPVRVLDTRSGTGGRSTPLGGGETHDLGLAGRAGVPADATAVALNLTGTRVSSGTHLTVWPSGAARPETAVLNLRPGETAASLVVAGLGAGGASSVRNLAGSVDLVADVVGYWSRSAGARYHPVAPARLLDTRRSEEGARRLADQETRTLPVRGRGGVPSSATGVVLNVTAVGPQRAGYLAVTPSGTSAGTSSVNFVAGETVPNRVVTGLSDAGAVDVLAAGSTHVLVDVVGWFAPTSVAGGSTYTALTPSRLVDSRDGTGTPRGAFGAGVTRDVQATGRGGVPTGATAVVLSLTATGPTASQGFVTAWADGQARPGTSDLNTLRGRTRSNLAVVPLSGAGRMSLYNASGSTHVIADVLGYYAAP